MTEVTMTHNPPKDSPEAGSRELNAALMFAMSAALTEAERFRGATAPNPAVGAAAIAADGSLLHVRAHERAGEGHAEANLLNDLRAQSKLHLVRGLAVTLEPCNHTGKTPPCTDAILEAGIHDVLIGVRDPNPKVEGRGFEKLVSAGVRVSFLSESPQQRPLLERAERLIAPFERSVRTGFPYITLKTVHRDDSLSAESMIPPEGSKTFASPGSLKFAHELRRRADAILTGSGTVIADAPEFTVRHVPDHSACANGKPRRLLILDRRLRVGLEYFNAATARGLRVTIVDDLVETIRMCGREGILELLVEAGPELSHSILDLGIWAEHVRIVSDGKGPDRISTIYNERVSLPRRESD